MLLPLNIQGFTWSSDNPVILNKDFPLARDCVWRIFSDMLPLTVINHWLPSAEIAMEDDNEYSMSFHTTWHQTSTHHTIFSYKPLVVKGRSVTTLVREVGSFHLRIHRGMAVLSNPTIPVEERNKWHPFHLRLHCNCVIYT